MMRRVTYIKPLSACPVHIREIIVNNVPADGLARGGARPSAGTVMIAKVDMFLPKFFGHLHL